jgi:hypothetical protein
VYFIGDFVCFFVLCGFASSDSGRKILARAALACVILNLIFVVLDLVTYSTNTTELLSFIRNSTYSMLSDTELAGFKRIVGSFVEASSFSYWTMGYFAFATSLWLNGIATRLTLCLSILSFVALLFSTSTTAYVGMAVFLFLQFVATGFKLLFRPVRPQMIVFLVALPMIFGLIVVMICLNDASYSYVANLLDTLVLNKMSTASGVERSNWNSQAIQNFLDTFGFGAGNVQFSDCGHRQPRNHWGHHVRTVPADDLVQTEQTGSASGGGGSDSRQIRLFGLAGHRHGVRRLYRSRFAVFRLCGPRMRRTPVLSHARAQEIG